MSDDIAARLRILSHHAKKLAENESLHDLHFDALTRCEDLTLLAAEEIQRLRKERDEARQRVCEMHIHYSNAYRKVGSQIVQCETVQEVAKAYRWNCYGEHDDLSN